MRCTAASEKAPAARETDPSRRLETDPLVRALAIALLVFILWQGANHLLLMDVWRLPMVTYHLASALVETALAGTVAVCALRALMHKNWQLVELNRQKELLAQAAVSDLRQPLAVLVSGLFAALQRGHLEEETKDWLQIVQLTAADMNALIDDLLDIASLEAGQQILSLQDISPVGFISAGTEDVGLTAWDKGIDLSVSVPADLPSVAGDPSRLRRVVMNLVSNAVKFTPAGGRVRVEAKNELEPTRVVVTVSDTGTASPKPISAASSISSRSSEGRDLADLAGLDWPSAS